MKKKEHFSSHYAFIMAAAAAAVGLGNIWRFPYITGEHGGSAFVLLYLLFVALLGFPLILAEMVVGRAGGFHPAKSFHTLAKKLHLSRHWSILGYWMVAAAFLILSYYSVIAGWVLDYFVKSLFGYAEPASQQASTSLFNNLLSTPWEMLLFTTLLFAFSAFILLHKIKQGLERAVLIMFPALFILLLLLMVFALMGSHAGEGLAFLFQFKWQDISATTIVVALGQAFFSLNVGLAVNLMFTAYLPSKAPLVRSAVAIAVMDTVIALMAGCIIFPIVFSFGLKTATGPSLIFQSLPLAFAKMTGGRWLQSAFFLMLEFAALTSIIALLEPVIMTVMDKCKLSRRQAVIKCTFYCWLMSLCTISSFSHPQWMTVNGHTVYEWIDLGTANFMLPMGGLFLAIFVGWRMNSDFVCQRMSWQAHKGAYRLWRWSLRYLTPVAIILIFIKGLGLI